MWSNMLANKIITKDLNLYYGDNHALKSVNMDIKEKAEKKKRNILYVFSEDDVLIKEAEEPRVLFSNFKDAYETKRSFLFLSTNGFDLTLNKNAIQDEKLTELLQYQCERIHKNIN